jgi:uncharacterized damage-inducible protein DinB
MNSEVDRFIRNWNRIHKETSRIIRSAPDDKLDWRPGDDMFTLRELIGHLPEAELGLVRAALQDQTRQIGFDTSNKVAGEIADLFDRQHDGLAAEVSQLTETQLGEEVEFHGRQVRRAVLLKGMTEHEIHHRGQLFVYYRLAGVEPSKAHE